MTPSAGGEVGFAGAGRAEQHDVAGLGKERAGGERSDLLTDGGLVVPVEVVEGFAGGEPGAADPLRGAGRVAGGDFAFEDRGEVVLMGPAGVTCLVGEPGGGFGDPWRLQRGGEVVDLLDRVRGVPAAWRPSGDLPMLIESERPVVVGEITDEVDHRRPRRRGCWNCSRSSRAVST